MNHGTWKLKEYLIDVLLVGNMGMYDYQTCV